jgi:DNA-binding GntR family transcriptional regulator
MRRFKRAENANVILLKATVAEQLYVEIVEVRLGSRREDRRGKLGKLGVSQASIRKAIYILVKDGLVAKARGRSARVVSLSANDVRRYTKCAEPWRDLAPG